MVSVSAASAIAVVEVASTIVLVEGPDVVTFKRTVAVATSTVAGVVDLAVVVSLKRYRHNAHTILEVKTAVPRDYVAQQGFQEPKSQQLDACFYIFVFCTLLGVHSNGDMRVPLPFAIVLLVPTSILLMIIAAHTSADMHSIIVVHLAALMRLSVSMGA